MIKVDNETVQNVVVDGEQVSLVKNDEKYVFLKGSSSGTRVYTNASVSGLPQTETQLTSSGGIGFYLTYNNSTSLGYYATKFNVKIKFANGTYVQSEFDIKKDYSSAPTTKVTLSGTGLTSKTISLGGSTGGYTLRIVPSNDGNSAEHEFSVMEASNVTSSYYTTKFYDDVALNYSSNNPVITFQTTYLYDLGADECKITLDKFSLA